jgi:hypothetical protein
MDEDTKIATLEKAAAVKHFVGFPEWLLDRDELEVYYEGVSKRRTRVFVTNRPIYARRSNNLSRLNGSPSNQPSLVLIR